MAEGVKLAVVPLEHSAHTNAQASSDLGRELGSNLDRFNPSDRATGRKRALGLLLQNKLADTDGGGTNQHF